MRSYVLTVLDRFGLGGLSERESPLVARSRLHALATQLPPLFVILATNICALSLTYFPTAPWFLTMTMPAVALPLFVSRIISWRRLDIDALSDQAVGKRLRLTMIVSFGIGLSIVSWAVSLFPYGGVFARAHIAFFMAVTCIGCLICLVHLRFGILVLAAILTAPVVVLFLHTGDTTFSVIAVNFAIVTAILCLIALTHYANFRRLIETTRDLADLSEANRRLAEIDSLTGLANRRSFLEEIETRIEGARWTNDMFAVGLIDLDGFKPINDIFGHHVGDRVLAEVGRRLHISLADTCVVARLGGDEFAFLATAVDDTAAIERIGRRVCDAIAEPFDLASGRVRIGASIGIATFPEMAQTLDQLMERADFALYFAKDQSRGSAVMFTEDHERRIRERGLLEHELRRADLDRELTLVFQPVVDTRRARVISFEALARWNNGALGPVSPADFIPAAERIGLIGEISEMLFRKACAAASAWPDSVRLSFNLSASDLAAADAKDRLCQMVRACPLPPERLIFEITETSVMRDFAHSVTVLESLRALGCRIALDDFGTGFSSLSYVHRLPLDKLKIDKSFVHSLATDGVSFAIVRTIVDLCSNLDISCVVEGVETQEQADLLFSVGCTVMQGYLFGKPMAAHVLSADGKAPWSRRTHPGTIPAVRRALP